MALMCTLLHTSRLFAAFFKLYLLKATKKKGMEYELLLVISVLILLTLTLVDFHYLLLDTLWIT